MGSNDRADILVPITNVLLPGYSRDNDFGVVRAKLNFKF